jgi:hypothetical protein
MRPDHGLYAAECIIAFPTTVGFLFRYAFPDSDDAVVWIAMYLGALASSLVMGLSGLLYCVKAGRERAAFSSMIRALCMLFGCIGMFAFQCLVVSLIFMLTSSQ